MEETIIIGRNPVLEAIQQGKEIEQVFLFNEQRGDFEIQIRNLCKQNGIELKKVPKEKLSRLSKGNHQGVVAVLSVVEYADLHDVYEATKEANKVPLFLILDGITDVRNIGAIARSAEIMGVDGIIVAAKNRALINSIAVKTSAGALLNIPICRVGQLSDCFSFLAQRSIKIVGTTLSADTPIHQVDLTKPLAIMMGSEEKGIHPHNEMFLDESVIIPQLGQTESLNVSAATAIILYEAQRQRDFII